jgi:hypothetical protein
MLAKGARGYGDRGVTVKVYQITHSKMRHAAAAIVSGLCDTVLITHGESGRSGVGRTRNVVAPTSLAG